MKTHERIINFFTFFFCLPARNTKGPKGNSGSAMNNLEFNSARVFDSQSRLYDSFIVFKKHALQISRHKPFHATLLDFQITYKS